MRNRDELSQEMAKKWMLLIWLQLLYPDTPESKSETAELISHTSEYNSFLLQPVSIVFSVPGN